MRPDSVFRRTPFRLAVAFTALFSIALLLSGIIAYRVMIKELVEWQDRRIEETFRALSQEHADHDREDLAKAVALRIAATRDHENVILLESADGRVLAGNMPAIERRSGWRELSGDALGVDPEYSYRLFEGSVGDNRLIVGMSNDVIYEFEEIVLAAFGWASIAVVALALAGGALIAVRARQRLDAIGRTMDRIAQGDLGARIPLIGNGDDIDQLSTDVNQALKRLASVVDGMRQVSADIAHDLKTPLNRLKMTIETALARSARGLSVSDELEAASAESNQINDTFSALLRIAQIESGARKARFTTIDIADVMRQVADVYREVAVDAGQSLTFVCAAPSPVTVLGDRDLLTQMFANLIENAIRHAPEGTTIDCAVTVTMNSAVASIADNGRGIPEAERDHVLRRLYRLEKSRTTPGSGLGLSLVKAIAELHDARLVLDDNQPGLRVSVAFSNAGKIDLVAS